MSTELLDTINKAPKIRTKSELIAYRKQLAKVSSSFFANNQKFEDSKKEKKFDSFVCQVSNENPYDVKLKNRKQFDLENLKNKFNSTKHGIHNQSLPLFSKNLARIKSNIPVIQSPKRISIKKPQKTVSSSGTLKKWNWLNDDTVDIVEFIQVKRSVKIQQENFNEKKNDVYSEYFTKLLKAKRNREKIISVMKKKRNMLIQNRINPVFRHNESRKSCEVRTTGFLEHQKI